MTPNDLCFFCCLRCLLLQLHGEYYDEESGHYYLRARYYDPVTARFISRDTYMGTLDNPLSHNLYTYCFNNPIIRIDPSGHDSYVLYEKTQWEDQAQSEKAKWEEKYGTDVHMIEVESEQDFIDGWNSMGKVNGEKVEIEGISLLFHGGARTIKINHKEDQYLTVLSNNKTPLGASATYIPDLDYKTAKELWILSCNPGHLDYENNVARTFKKNNSIDKVYGMDGSLSYFRNPITGRYIPRLAFDQRGFIKDQIPVMVPLEYQEVPAYRIPTGMIEH